MRQLLDIHALLWRLEGDPKLPGAAQAAIGESDDAVLASAASAWNITTRHRLGELADAMAALDFVTMSRPTCARSFTHRARARLRRGVPVADPSSERGRAPPGHG